MSEGAREIVPTRSMLLELAGERTFMREGHEFLDQKRMLLAGEILRRLARHEELSRRLRAALDAARVALRRGLARHGVSELWAYPAPLPVANAVELAPEMFLGIALVESRAGDEPGAPERSPVNPSPEARAVADRFRSVVALAAEIAGVQSSLARLLRDYRRTERRARALEDVILPELDASLASIEEHLDAQELEEAVRVRLRTR